MTVLIAWLALRANVNQVSVGSGDRNTRLVWTVAIVYYGIKSADTMCHWYSHRTMQRFMQIPAQKVT